MKNTISVALLVDSPELQGWERRAIDHLLEHTDANISLILINDASDAGPSPTDIVGDLSLWKMYSAYRRVVWLLTDEPWYRVRHPIPQRESADVYRVDPVPAEDLGQELPARAVAELETVDIAVRFGFGILQGESLTAPTHGVLSFHHGDLRSYRGRPAGFWELLDGESEVGITVQRLSETLDGGEIAAFDTVEIGDLQSWPRVLHRLFEASEPLLTRALENIVQSDNTKNPEELGALYSTPRWRDTLRYLGRRVSPFAD